MQELHVEKIFIDKISGKNIDRPKLKEMMNFVRNGDTVVVESISRFARNTRDLLELVDQLVTKNVQFASIRDISLGNELSIYLLNFKRQESLVSGFNDNWFILGRNKPLPQTSIDRIKNQAIKISGVKKIKIHDFRHSHASYLIANGMNIVAVSKRLGHSDVNMTLKVYTHLFKKNDDEITEFLDKSWIGGKDNYFD